MRGEIGAALFLLVVLTTLLTPRLSYSSEGVNIAVETSKPSYVVGEDVCLNGVVTYNDYPLQMKLVGIEVRNQDQNTTLLLATRQTDPDGKFSLTFKLASQTRSGIYVAVATTDGFGKTVKATAAFNVYIPGDVDGNFEVDMRDLAAVSGAYGTSQTSPLWNPVYDINGDGTVNMRDIYIVCRNFGKTSL